MDQYLEGLPKEEAEMRQLFELVFNVGTSNYWSKDPELITELNRIFWALDKEVIRPWVNQE